MWRRMRKSRKKLDVDGLMLSLSYIASLLLPFINFLNKNLLSCYSECNRP